MRGHDLAQMIDDTPGGRDRCGAEMQEVYGETDPAVEAAFGRVRRALRSIRPGPRRTGSNTAGPAAHLHKRW